MLGARVSRAELVARELEREITEAREPGERLGTKEDLRKDDPATSFKYDWALHRRIAELCRNSPLRSMYLALIDFLEYRVDRGDLAEFDGEAMLAVHRNLVEAIDRGEGPELDAAIEAHAPARNRHRPSVKRLAQG